jgi:tetratricopeptide (TPR) repeat protein
MRLAALLLVSLTLATPARAAGGDDEERARAHYEIGLGLYRLGDYRAALKEFAAGYELARKPGFLLNLGQTYRKLGELREARDMYRQFLAEVHLDDPARPQAQKVLAELEEALRRQPPPEPPPEPAPSPPSPPVAAPEPAPEPPSVASTPPAVRASAAPRLMHRGLRIAGVTIGVVGLGLVGGGIGTAVAADGLAKDLNAADQAGAVFDPSKDRAYSLDRALSIGFLVSGCALTATGAILLVVSAR